MSCENWVLQFTERNEHLNSNKNKMKIGLKLSMHKICFLQRQKKKSFVTKVKMLAKIKIFNEIHCCFCLRDLHFLKTFSCVVVAVVFVPSNTPFGHTNLDMLLE